MVEWPKSTINKEKHAKKFKIENEISSWMDWTKGYECGSNWVEKCKSSPKFIKNVSENMQTIVNNNG